MNISVILPFYKKASLFRLTLPLNDLYRQPDVEVVCVLEDPTEELEVLKIVEQTPDVRFRVIVNDNPHEWRNPSVAYNVGIRRAIGAHVILTDPETCINLPSTRYLTRLISNSPAGTMFGGMTWMVWEWDVNSPLQYHFLKAEKTRVPWLVGGGFLMVKRGDIHMIHGFDESWHGYGGDDNQIRTRLLQTGVRWVIDPGIKMFHLYHVNPSNRSADPHNPNNWTSDIMLHHQSDSWGREFDRTPWDWRTMK